MNGDTGICYWYGDLLMGIETDAQHLIENPVFVKDDAGFVESGSGKRLTDLMNNIDRDPFKDLPVRSVRVVF